MRCAVCEDEIKEADHVLVDASKAIGKKVDFHIGCAPFVCRGWKPESKFRGVLGEILTLASHVMDTSPCQRKR